MEESIIIDDLNKLAYIGDAYFELYTRQKLVNLYGDSINMNDLHKINTNLVCAKSQSKYIDNLIENNILNEKELDIYKRSRNLHTNTKSKNSPVRDYRKATGFEALIGYLYLNNDLDRLNQILSSIDVK